MGEELALYDAKKEKKYEKARADALVKAQKDSMMKSVSSMMNLRK